VRVLRGVAVHRGPEERVAELVAEHLQHRRAARIDVTAQEELERIHLPSAPHQRAARARVGGDRLLLRTESVYRTLVPAVRALAVYLFHERGEALVEPRVGPALGGEE